MKIIHIDETHDVIKVNLGWKLKLLEAVKLKVKKIQSKEWYRTLHKKLDILPSRLWIKRIYLDRK